jgi:Ni/Co efflux regulator RcnB
MKSTAIACAIAASALGFGSLSFAQGSGWDRNERSEGREDRRDDRRADRHESREHRRDDRQARRDGRHEQHGQYHQRNFNERRDQQPWIHDRAYGQPNHGQPYYQHSNRQHQWSGHTRHYQRGDHLPYQFRQRHYYVNDWRAHRGLYAPPYGYQWVQADSGDYLLVALATGLIANLLLNQY